MSKYHRFRFSTFRFSDLSAFPDGMILVSLYCRGPGGRNLAYYRVYSSRPDALKTPQMKTPSPGFRVLFKEPHKSQTLRSGANTA